MSNEVLGAMGILVIWVLVFILARVFVLWYWRVNESVALLKSIDDKLGKLVAQGGGPKEPYV